MTPLRRYVICVPTLLFLIVGVWASSAAGKTVLDKKIDSLFVIASSGEVKFQKMVQPAKDSIAALGAQAAPRLVQKLDTKSARERVTIMEILKKIGSAAVPELVHNLGDTCGLRVERICGSLGEIADSSATLPLVEISRHHRWQVREQSVGALGSIRDQRGAAVVDAALADSNEIVRKAAAVSAGKLKLNGSTAKLVGLLGDPFYGARMSAAASLLSLDTTTVLRTLNDSLASPSALLGDVACSVLGKLGGEEAVQLLFTQSKAADPDRRGSAAVALIQADPKNTHGYHQTMLDAETDRLVRVRIQSAIDTYAHGTQ